MSQCLILIDALSSACWEKKEKNGEVARAFFPEPESGHSCARQDFNSC
jgi:hypothetical protein